MARRRVGVISDTHGLLRREALAALAGCDLILHAGDIGSRQVLDALSAIASVVAVRGNNDRGAWARRLPLTQLISAGAVPIYMIHDLSTLRGYPPARVIVSGHSHLPTIREDADSRILYLNPGSAGPRRFNLPITLARLTIAADAVGIRIVPLG